MGSDTRPVGSLLFAGPLGGLGVRLGDGRLGDGTLGRGLLCLRLGGAEAVHVGGHQVGKLHLEPDDRRCGDNGGEGLAAVRAPHQRLGLHGLVFGLLLHGWQMFLDGEPDGALGPPLGEQLRHLKEEPSLLQMHHFTG